MAYKRDHVKERFRPKPGKLLDQVREVMRYHHYAIRTEKTYIKERDGHYLITGA